MPKRVRMVAQIVPEKCTGCRLCEQVCPTVAIGMRPRQPDEPGPGRNIAVLAPEACYNAQACVEICRDDAIEMVELAELFDVGFEYIGADSEAVKALCRKAGYGRAMQICVCTDTKAGEIAAAIVAGAHTPEAVSLATGARTGCVELCMNPILHLLACAGHGDAPRNPKTVSSGMANPPRCGSMPAPTALCPRISARHSPNSPSTRNSGTWPN